MTEEKWREKSDKFSNESEQRKVVLVNNKDKSHFSCRLRLQLVDLSLSLVICSQRADKNTKTEELMKLCRRNFDLAFLKII